MAIISYWWDIAIAAAIIADILALLWMKRRYSYWKNRGVPGPEPSYIFGNIKETLLLQKHIAYGFGDIYNAYRDKPFVGAFMMFRPVLLINDLELIKHVLVKDFSSFHDRLFELNPKYEPLSEHLFNIRGERWKAMRTKITPAFTTNKMKFMFETMKNCNVEMEKFLEKSVKKDNTLNAKEFLSLLGINIIGSCAFGVECNAFENPHSDFVKAGNALFKMNALQHVFQLVVLFCMPELAKQLKFSILGKKTNDFFHNLVKNGMEYRNGNNITRNDFLQILMQLQEHGHLDENVNGESKPNNEPRLTTLQMAAQSFIFFVAGFETSSTTSSFALYELALNQDVQDKLREEINEVLKKHDDQVTYESLMEMTYLTQVIDEALRKYPPVAALFRLCTKDTKLPNSDLLVEKDTAVFISTFALHRDPQYFPDPEKFDPERFSAENKASIPHFSYIPFGDGPRNCIGARFGMMQVRLALVTFVLNYKISVCDKTPIPMDFTRTNLVLASKTGIWLKLTKIEK